MFKVNRNIHINAPVDKVFAFLEDKRHLPEIWPSMIEVSDEEPLEGGGKRYNWVYKMAGMRFTGTTEELEFERNRRIVGTSKEAIENELTWNFRDVDGGTDILFEAAYHIPVPLVGKIAEPLLAKMNEAEADLVLSNLKTRLEG